MIDGILHYAFSTADIEKTLDFYCRLLGFKFLFHLNDESGKPKTFYTRLGKTQFFEFFLSKEKFGRQPETCPGKYLYGYHHASICVENLDEMEQSLKKENYLYTRDREGDCPSLWTRSPDGDLLRIYQK